MPELPEVETIVRELRKKIIGLKITDVWVDRPKIVKQAGGIKKFSKQIKNKKILNVRRRAKYIIMEVEGKKTIFIHQKISGHLLYGKWIPLEAARVRSAPLPLTGWKSVVKGPLQDDKKNGYLRFILYLNNGYQLGLSDLRRFGKVILIDDEKIKDLKEISGLGPEPLEIKFKDFKKLFKNKKRKIKQVLMDPAFIAGIGNIYADEVLWSSDIHPLSRTENLNERDFKKIYSNIVKILKKAIEYGGSSTDDYRMPSGRKGRFQEFQNAYQKTGQKCKKKDGGIIKRLKLAGRSAHFCDKHQILK